MISQAQVLSARVHAAQRDQAGAPYAGHPARVAANVQSHPAFATLEAADREDLICAAYLHDVIEDGPEFGFFYTPGDLIRMGFSLETANIVRLLTKPPGISAEELDPYYLEIAEHPGARLVKLADIADNTNYVRAARLPAELRNRLAAKYVHALDMLSLSSEEHGWLEELRHKDV